MPHRRYEEDLVRQIEAWKEKISELENRGEKLDPQTKSEFLDLMKQINAKNEEIQNIIVKFEKGGEVDHSRLRSEIENLLADLNENYRDALSYYH